MRKLSTKQKNIVIDYIKNYEDFEDHYFDYKKGVRFILIKQLEKHNDYETLYQDLDRLVNDLIFKDTKEEKIDYVKKFI